MKYIELVKEMFTAKHNARAKQEEPYIAYSKEANRLMLNFIPKPHVTFTAEEDSSSIGLVKLSTNQTLEYSTDTTTWNTFDTTTNIPLNTGDKVYVRGVLSADNTSSKYTQFKMSGKIAASGNCNAIWNHQDLNAPLKAYCGYRMFYNCASLTIAPELPATTLAEWCYAYMFYGCSSLAVAPELPATELANYCYNALFAGCTSLTTSPELPAATLAERCYTTMFANCTSLTTAPELPTTTLAEGCYYNMFYNCTSLITAPVLPATTLADGCYYRMFYGCTSLVTAPVLPATTLVNNCYQNIFSQCTSLNHIACLATDISATNCTYSWVSGVSSTGTFIKHLDMNNWTTGNFGIPIGWAVEDSYTPQECVNLEITADNVSGIKTNTTIYYTAITNGIDYKGNRVDEQIVTGTATSNEFEQNTSYTDTIERTITFEFIGVTATTTITQGVWVDPSYKVILNDQWRLSETQSNPNSTLYDGVYESFSNRGKNNSTATMYLDLVGYTEFDVYIRSYAQSYYDYVTISEPNSTTVKSTTSGTQNSGQSINYYKKVHYDNLTGEDRITITYRKDSSGTSGADQGYILIPKQ